MSRLRYNNSVGTLGASLTSTGTTITFASAPSFATIVSPDYIPLILEPTGTSPSANFEIVYLTAYTAAATTGTITRGQEGTTAVAHSNGVAWACGPVATDVGVLMFGTAAALPAAAVGNAGTAYYATDTGGITFSDGATWHEIKQVGSPLILNASYPYIEAASGNLYLRSSSNLDVYIDQGSLNLAGVGRGIKVVEGANAKQGTATLVAGTVTVANTSVTATSRIFLTIQTPGGTVGSVYVSARTAGTSFTITSTSSTDTSVVAYEIFEVGG